MLADKPQDEQARLAALRGYGVLDSAPERAYDEVVALAAALFDVPVALISLVDGNRQWFKARVGAPFVESPLEESICAHAILGEGLLEIPDTMADPRTADNPVCCGPTAEMRFYAGAPLVTPEGHRLGTLCVLDDRPRRLDPVQRQALEVLAHQVMARMELSRALKAERALRDEIDHRVKNSLQTVLSYLRLYRNRATGPETRDVLDAAILRVSAVSDLHLALYENDSRASVALDRYLGRLLRLIAGQAPEGVVLDDRLEPVRVRAELAGALALVLSEFASNSFKHAFGQGGPGTLTVTLARQDGALVLDCADSGRPEGHAPAGAESTGIGLRLIEAAAEQAGATLTLGPAERGYALRLVIPPGRWQADPRGEASAA